MSRRTAFSLVEMLVVLALCGVLLALTVPAIQRVREASNMIVCQQRLRQLGIAAQNFHTTIRRLPYGYLGPSLKRNLDFPSHLSEGQWIGHLPILMKYMEQDDVVWDLQVNLSKEVVTELPWFWGKGPLANPVNYRIAMQRVPALRCPSTLDYVPEVGRPEPQGGGTQIGLHVFNSKKLGPFTDGWKDDYVRSSAYRFLGRTNYLGVAGCGSGDHPFYSRYEGIYTNRSERTLGQISRADGSANTLLYGEACGSVWQGNQPETYDISWMGGGALGTYLGLFRGQDTPIIAFSSNHPSGVNFCFADGSVRTLHRGGTHRSVASDWKCLQQLAGWRDGAQLDQSLIED